mgnify:CR=1 FL=1
MICNYCGEDLDDGQCSGVCLELEALDEYGYDAEKDEVTDG